jgi:hypothetical protein
MWVQVSSNAYRCPLEFATLTFVPATSNARICPSATSVAFPIFTNMTHPPVFRRQHAVVVIEPGVQVGEQVCRGSQDHHANPICDPIGS